jgi:hypothetical protein
MAVLELPRNLIPAYGRPGCGPGPGRARCGWPARLSSPGPTALLIERCQPGTLLRRRPQREQDTIVAGLLRRLAPG